MFQIELLGTEKDRFDINSVSFPNSHCIYPAGRPQPEKYKKFYSWDLFKKITMVLVGSAGPPHNPEPPNTRTPELPNSRTPEHPNS